MQSAPHFYPDPFKKAQDVFPMKVTPEWGKSSGRLAVTGSVNWETGMSHHQDQPAKQTSGGGVYVCQHLSFTAVGKACKAERAPDRARVAIARVGGAHCFSLKAAGDVGQTHEHIDAKQAVSATRDRSLRLAEKF
jgi:hypothetical protein